MPGSPTTVVEFTEVRDSSALAMSQDEVKVAVPVGLNWNEQSSGATVTTTGVCCAAASAGFAVLVSRPNTGK